MGRLYVAYGSNMIEEQMQVRCPKAHLVSKEILSGYQLECRDIYSGVYLNAIEDTSSSIPVYVWEIEDEDEENLDVYEGYPQSYIKVEVPTSLGSAMMYVMSDNVGECGIPAKEYIQPIYDLYLDEGYSLDVLDRFMPYPERSK